jgi:post-segregation antitoxin (ccd killing protein)
MAKVDKVEIDAALLQRARALGLSVETLASESIKREIARRQGMGVGEDPQPFTPVDSTTGAKAKRWADENADAIADQQERIADHGVFGEDFRTW